MPRRRQSEESAADAQYPLRFLNPTMGLLISSSVTLARRASHPTRERWVRHEAWIDGERGVTVARWKAHFGRGTRAKADVLAEDERRSVIQNAVDQLVQILVDDLFADALERTKDGASLLDEVLNVRVGGIGDGFQLVFDEGDEVFTDCFRAEQINALS